VGYQKKLMVQGLSLTPPPPQAEPLPPPPPEPTVEEQIASLEDKLEECLRTGQGQTIAVGLYFDREESLRRRIRELRGEPEPVQPIKPQRYVYKRDEGGRRVCIDRMRGMTTEQSAAYERATTQAEVDRILDDCGFVAGSGHRAWISA